MQQRKYTSNSQLHKLNSGKNCYKSNFPHKLLLIDTQVSRLHRTFANNSSGNVKLSRTPLSKIV